MDYGLIMAYSDPKAIMSSTIELKFLGTGTSVGVPQIGCQCKVCRSCNLKNKRLRSSILVSCGGTNVLIDSSPDLRQQALRENITDIDAVVYTHAHLDHVVGFDDLRAFCWHREGKLPLYASEETMSVLRAMYPWAFSSENSYRGYVRPEPREIKEAFDVGGLRLTPLPVEHANVQTNGYLIEAGGARIAYAPDVKSIPEESIQLWQKLDILILDALRFKFHRTHMTVEETLAMIEKLNPAAAYLTHMSHEVDYEEIVKSLPGNVFAAYDGLSLTVKV